MTRTWTIAGGLLSGTPHEMRTLLPMLASILVGKSDLSGNLSRWATVRVAGGDISSLPSRPATHWYRPV